jgi:hypothetical protein
VQECLGNAGFVKLQRCLPWFVAILWEDLCSFLKWMQAMVNVNTPLLERHDDFHNFQYMVQGVCELQHYTVFILS